MKKSIAVGVVAGVSILVLAYSISRFVPVGASPAGGKASVKPAVVKTP
jgi:hypothetical protein